MRVAEPAIATARQPHGLAHFGEIADQRLTVLLEDLGADRDLEDGTASVAARAIFAHAFTAALGLEMLLVAVIDEGIETIHACGADIAPAPAIAAIGPAKLDKLLPPKGDAAVAAADIDLRLVEKFHGAPQEPRPSRLSAARQKAAPR